MPRLLSDLEPAEVSLVGKGANKKKFLVFKSAGENGMSKALDLLKSKLDADTFAKVQTVLKDATAPGNSGMGAGDLPPKPDSATFKEGDDERTQAAMKAAARILAPHKDKLGKGHMDALAKELGMGMGEGEGGGKEAGMMNQPQEVKEEHHVAALEKAKQAYGAELAKMGYRKYPDQQPTQKGKPLEDDDDAGGEDVSKSAKVDLSAFPENQRAALELIFKNNEQLVKKNESLESEVKSLRDEKKLSEYREEAKNFTHLGADTEELATIMKSMSEKDPDGAEKMKAILKAANAQVKAGGSLYSEIGSRIAKSDAGSPDGKMRAMVDSFVQKSDGSKTREQIEDDLFVNNREYKRLYSEYMASHPGMKGGGWSEGQH
jgi:hypothetical protein